MNHLLAKELFNKSDNTEGELTFCFDIVEHNDKKNNGLVSIIYPLFNNSTNCISLIRNAINTTQYLPNYECNIEILIIDTGSTRNEYMIIQNFVNHLRDKRIRFFAGNASGSLYYAIKKGISEARGNFITWITDNSEFNVLYLKTLVHFDVTFAHKCSTNNTLNHVNTLITNMSKLENTSKTAISFINDYSVSLLNTDTSNIPLGLQDVYKSEKRTSLFLWKTNFIKNISITSDDVTNLSTPEFILNHKLNDKTHIYYVLHHNSKVGIIESEHSRFILDNYINKIKDIYESIFIKNKSGIFMYYPSVKGNEYINVVNNLDNNYTKFVFFDDNVYFHDITNDCYIMNIKFDKLLLNIRDNTLVLK